MKNIKQLWKLDWIATFRFNFHYFRFKDAVRLPVFLYRKTKIVSLKGTVTLKMPARPGMMRLGIPLVPINNCRYNFIYENNGGDLFIHSGGVGSGSAISLQKGAKLTIGKQFSATCNVKLIAAQSITIGDNCVIGWDSMVMDTDWHAVYDIETKTFSEKTQPVEIGSYTWIANGCQILKGSVTPKYCIVGAKSLLTKNLNAPSCSLIAGSPAKVIKTNVLYEGFVEKFTSDSEG